MSTLQNDGTNDVNATEVGPAVEIVVQDVALGIAEARRTLDNLPPDESKFEKYGHFVTRILDTELRLSHKPQTRLYKYQIEAVFAVKKHFEGEGVEAKQPALIVAPPGSGKSGMATLIPYALKSGKVFILTPAEVLSYQLAAEFGYSDISTTFNPFFRKCGMFLEQRQLKSVLEYTTVATTQKDIDHMTASNLVIVNAQKFAGRSANTLSPGFGTPERKHNIQTQLEEFDTIIVDEAHHYPASTWELVVDIFAEKKVIFLTATPWRGETHMVDVLNQQNKQLKLVYEIPFDLLEGVTIRPSEFIERPAVNKDLKDPGFLEQLKGDIEECLAKHQAKEKRMSGHQAMILVRTRVEAEEVARGLGDKATFVIPTKEGKENLTLFTKGKKSIVVVCGMLKEGYDNPNVSLVVILRKCTSHIMFGQFWGRCLRMNRNLTGTKVDQTVGTLLSYQHFNQSPMWATRLKITEEDPENEDEDGNTRNLNTIFDYVIARAIAEEN